MFTIFALICLQLLSNCQIFGTGFIGAVHFDPDIDLCNDPYLSGGVVADDGKSYLFKGDYYWRIRTLTTDSGIKGSADITANKWPEVRGGLQFVFTFSMDEDLMTVFVLKTNEWFGYQRGQNVMNGTVGSWPGFKGLKVSAAFTPTFGGQLVYVLHSDNSQYVLYDLKDILKPKKVSSGPTTVRNDYLLFTEEGAQSMPGTELKNLIDIRAGLTYRTKLFLLSNDRYCVISLSADSFERECDTKSINELLECPLDIENRPKTTSNRTQTKKTDKSTNSKTMATKTMEEISLIDSRTSIATTNGGPAVRDKYKTTKTRDEDFRTGITILGHKLEDEEVEPSVNSTVADLAPGLVPDDQKMDSKNTVFWFFGFVVVLIAVSTLFISGLILSFKKKRAQGNVSYIN